MSRDFKLDSFQYHGSSGMDSFLGETLQPAAANPSIQTTMDRLSKAASRRVKVGSLQQLEGFQRLSQDTLIHQSTRDLWSLQKDSSGNFVIEQLFDPEEGPLKG